MPVYLTYTIWSTQYLRLYTLFLFLEKVKCYLCCVSHIQRREGNRGVRKDNLKSDLDHFKEIADKDF